MNTPFSISSERTASSAFSLVEVVLALGIFSFAAMAIFALFPVGMDMNRTTLDETTAVGKMTAVINDRLCTPREQPSKIYGLPAITTGMSSAPQSLYIDEDSTVSTAATARFRVDYTISPPAVDSAGPFTIFIRASWPASAAEPTGWVETVAAIPQSIANL